MDLENPSIGTRNTVSNEQASSEVIASSIPSKQKQPQLQNSRVEGSHCREAMLNLETDFPTLWNQIGGNGSDPMGKATLPTSWRDKVTSQNHKIGMPLKFVAPMLENGKQIVHIDTHDLENLVTVRKSCGVLCGWRKCYNRSYLRIYP